MKEVKIQNSKFKIIIPLLISFAFSAVGCQKVDKPVRGEEGSSPMAIVIEGDAPDSHIANTTSEGEKLVNPYSAIPVAGSIFKTSAEGLEFWKANHPNLVTGTHNPALKADPDESCLMCHDQNTSCNNCHGYVGVKLVTSDE